MRVLEVRYTGVTRVSVGFLWSLKKGFSALALRHRLKRDGISVVVLSEKQSRPGHWGRISVRLSGEPSIILKEEELLGRFLLRDLDTLTRSNRELRAGILNKLADYGISGYNWLTGLSKEGILQAYSLLGILIEWDSWEVEDGEKKE